MSDVADRAEWRIAKDLQTAIQHALKIETLESDGHCRFCDEQISYPRRFCNADCRDDYDAELAACRRNGYKFG